MCEYDFDHIIVGGGITGSSAAYQLSKRNARVLVLERRKITRVTCEEEEEDAKFVNNIINTFEVAESRKYEDEEFHAKLPYLTVGTSQAGYCDNPGEVLTSSTLLSGGVLMAHALLRVVQDLAARNGAVIMDDFYVENIKCYSNFVEVIGGEEKVFTAKSAVVCPGAWGRALLSKIGVSLPLMPSQVPVYDWDAKEFLPNTPDNNPVIDTLPGKQNIAIAVGFSGIGFKLGPMAGTMLADLAMGVNTRQAITSLSFSRFCKGTSRL